MPGSPVEQHHLALAVAGQPPALQQQRQLVLAADQRGQAGGPPGLEPARGVGLSPATRQARTGSASRAGHPAEVDELEHACRAGAASVGDDDRAGLGQLLQARRQVRGLADHRLLARRTLADEVADHHEPGRDRRPAPRAARCPACRSRGRRPRPQRARPGPPARPRPRAPAGQPK